jgi:hydrogenase expression/formation protein HypD
VKYQDEFRDAATAKKLAAAIARIATKPWTIMEVCGGQTHAIVRFGIDELLTEKITLVHGPGCPVCVTPVEVLDRALAVAARPSVTFCSFGDMLRVPGTGADLFSVKAAGGDVRVVYSPLDAVSIAREHPEREVVFFAVGFETTAPANAMAVAEAARLRLENFSILVAHVLVPPAIEAVLRSPASRVQGFLAAGHVCAIQGTEEYVPLVERYRVPIVVTGFEPVDILRGVFHCVRQLEEGRAAVENAYARVVRDDGNARARALVRRVFRVVPQKWRGLGAIEGSGLALRDAYARFDAARRFGVETIEASESPDCRSGLVLQGLLKPTECPAFGTRCTPDTPLGATMVSAEGACSAYYRYRRCAPCTSPS